MVDKDIDYFHYAFDKLFHIAKFHKNSLNENSVKDIIHVMCAFFKISEKDFLVEVNNCNLDLNENSNNYEISKKNISENTHNTRSMIDEDDEYLKFLFYTNFDSYYNLKYVFKAVLLNNAITENLNYIRIDYYERFLESIVNR